jgi:hypothetical protein
LKKSTVSTTFSIQSNQETMVFRSKFMRTIVPIHWIFLCLLSLSFFLSCTSSDDLAISGGIDLKEVAKDSKLNPRERADKMMEALNAVLREVSKEKDNPKAAAKLDSYLEANSEALNKITQDFGDWSLKASQEDLMDYIGGLQSKAFYAELDSNLTLVGYRMMESPELEKSMTKLLALINPPS